MGVTNLDRRRNTNIREDKCLEWNHWSNDRAEIVRMVSADDKSERLARGTWKTKGKRENKKKWEVQLVQTLCGRGERVGEEAQQNIEKNGRSLSKESKLNS